MHETKLAERVIELCPDLMGMARTSEQLLSDPRTVQSLVDLVERNCKEIERLQERFDLALRKNGEQWAEIERLRKRIKFIYTSSNGDLYAEIERLQAVVDAAENLIYAQGEDINWCWDYLEEQIAALEGPTCTCGGGHDSFDGHSHECALFALEIDDD